MISIAKDLEFSPTNYAGRSIYLYCDSFSALTYIVSSYWNSSSSDTKLHLLRSFWRACEVATIKLIQAPVHSGICQNETVDKLARQGPRYFPVVDLNAEISKSNWFTLVSEQPLFPAPYTNEFPGISQRRLELPLPSFRFCFLFRSQDVIFCIRLLSSPPSSSRTRS